MARKVTPLGKNLSSEEELRLVYQARCPSNSFADSRALNDLLSHHSGLIYACAIRWSRFPLYAEDEVISWAREGFWAAVKHFDEDKGVKFSAYAYRRMRWNMKARSGEEKNTWGMSNFSKEHWVEAVAALDERLAQGDSFEDALQYTSLEYKKTRSGLSGAYFVIHQGETVSLDKPIRYDEKSRTLASITPDTAVDVHWRSDLRQELRKAVRFLPYRPFKPMYVYRMMVYRFGLRDGVEHTQQETADKFGGTRQNLALIEKKVLKSFREIAHLTELPKLYAELSQRASQKLA